MSYNAGPITLHNIDVNKFDTISLTYQLTYSSCVSAIREALSHEYTIKYKIFPERFAIYSKEEFLKLAFISAAVTSENIHFLGAAQNV